MKYLLKKIYIVIFFLNLLFLNTNLFARDTQATYTKENISNYLSGIISSNQNYTSKAFKYLNKAQSIKKIILILTDNFFAHSFCSKNLIKHLLSRRIY